MSGPYNYKSRFLRIVVVLFFLLNGSVLGYSETLRPPLFFNKDLISDYNDEAFGQIFDGLGENVLLKAGEWLDLFNDIPTYFKKYLEGLYGSNPEVLKERIKVYIGALEKFIQLYGRDEDVIIVRSPARINLRGMHVDTHGGGLNLITHDRETVMVLSASKDTGALEFNNFHSDRFEPVRFSLREFTSLPEFNKDWNDFINCPKIKELISAERGHWGNYLKGAALSVRHRFKDNNLLGFKAVINSDIPQGAALSSSHSLANVVISGILALNKLKLSRKDMVVAIQDGEWFTGARSGLADQGAMVFGRRGEILNTPLFKEGLDLTDPKYIDLPEDKYSIMVIESFKTRSLSGRQKVDYSKPRFAYSIALDILKTELRKKGGYPEGFIKNINNLSKVCPDYFSKYGGTKAIYEALLLVPETITVDKLREKYPDIDIDGVYNRYFGDLSDEMKPKDFNVRGPLLWGISECCRAKRFYEHMVAAEYEKAFELLNVGHEGDRVSRFDVATGAIEDVIMDVSDEYIKLMLENLESGNSEKIRQASLELQPGNYRASSKALDTLVDICRSEGAKACLTGAGLAGVVIAVVEKGKGLEKRIATSIYEKYYKPNMDSLIKESDIVGIKLTEEDFRKGIRINVSVQGSGVLDPRVIGINKKEKELRKKIAAVTSVQNKNIAERKWDEVDSVSMELESLTYRIEECEREKGIIQDSIFKEDRSGITPQVFVVTGGAGFVGSGLAGRLLEKGHTVIVIDEFNDYYSTADKYDNVRKLMDHPRFVLYEGDFRDMEFLRTVFRAHKVDQIVHLGARAGVRPSIEDPQIYVTTNELGTTNMLEIAKEFEIKNFVYASSSSVYGGSKEFPFNESQRIDKPISPYAATKRSNEGIASTYHKLYGFPVTGLRFFTVYGPHGRPDMAPRKFTELMLQGKAVTMYGDGSFERDYTFVDDIVDGVMCSIEGSYGNKDWDRVYNLGESDTTPLLKLVLLIALETGRLDFDEIDETLKEPVQRLLEAHGKDQIKVLTLDEREGIIAYLVKKEIVKRAPEQPGDVPLTYANIDKAKKELGYDPQTKIKDGIKKTVAWHFAKERIGEDSKINDILGSYSDLKIRLGLDSFGIPKDPRFTVHDLNKAISLRRDVESLLEQSGYSDIFLIRIMAGVEQLIGNIASYFPGKEKEAFGLTGLELRKKKLHVFRLAREGKERLQGEVMLSSRGLLTDTEKKELIGKTKPIFVINDRGEFFEGDAGKLIKIVKDFFDNIKNDPEHKPLNFLPNIVAEAFDIEDGLKGWFQLNKARSDYVSTHLPEKKQTELQIEPNVLMEHPNLDKCPLCPENVNETHVIARFIFRGRLYRLTANINPSSEHHMLLSSIYKDPQYLDRDFLTLQLGIIKELGKGYAGTFSDNFAAASIPHRHAQIRKAHLDLGKKDFPPFPVFEAYNKKALGLKRIIVKNGNFLYGMERWPSTGFWYEGKSPKDLCDDLWLPVCQKLHNRNMATGIANTVDGNGNIEMVQYIKIPGKEKPTTLSKDFPAGWGRFSPNESSARITILDEGYFRFLMDFAQKDPAGFKNSMKEAFKETCVDYKEAESIIKGVFDRSDEHIFRGLIEKIVPLNGNIKTTAVSM